MLFAVRCANGLAVVSTTKETLYTDAPCGGLPDDHSLLMLPIRLTVHWSDDSAVVAISANEAGTVTFTAAHVWLASR